MNTHELATLLQSMGVPTGAYSIGADRNEEYCLVPDQGRWHVYYSERGNRNEETVFASEAEACQRLLDMLLSDRSVRADMPQDEG